jgi:hypothetical protein
LWSHAHGIERKKGKKVNYCVLWHALFFLVWEKSYLWYAMAPETKRKHQKCWVFYYSSQEIIHTISFAGRVLTIVAPSMTLYVIYKRDLSFACRSKQYKY